MDAQVGKQEEGARAALEREVYWAEEGTPRARMTTAEVRDAIHDYAVLMREDEKRIVPRGEPNLAARTRWKRQLKLRLFRVMRPITWRYDRLSADLAELVASLADRVAQLEAEVARLREAAGERGGGGEPGGGEPRGDA